MIGAVILENCCGVGFLFHIFMVFLNIYISVGIKNIFFFKWNSRKISRKDDDIWIGLSRCPLNTTQTNHKQWPLMRVTISCSALIQLPLSDTIIWKNIRALWRISSQMVCLGGQNERDPLILAEAKVDIITYVNFLCTNIFQCLNIYKNQEEVLFISTCRLPKLTN